MSGQHHTRTGWTYGPRPRGTCIGCRESKVLDGQGLVINHRERLDGRPALFRCTGSGHPPDPKDPIVTGPASTDPGAQDECAACSHPRWLHYPTATDDTCRGYVDCACGGHFVELSYGTRMARIIESAQQVAASISLLRDALQATMRATTTLCSAMQVAGLLPDDDQPDQTPKAAGKHTARITGPAPNPALMDEIHAHAERLPARTWDDVYGPVTPTDMELTKTIPHYRDDTPHEHRPNPQQPST